MLTAVVELTVLEPTICLVHGEMKLLVVLVEVFDILQEVRRCLFWHLTVLLSEGDLAQFKDQLELLHGGLSHVEEVIQFLLRVDV